MRTIFKIGKYNEDTNSISVKFCRLHSTKSIDDYASKLVDCSDLTLTTCESTGNLNINDLVGKVIETKVDLVDPYNRFLIPMREVTLWIYLKSIIKNVVTS